MDRLEDRVARLERANRRLLTLWGLTLAVASAFGFQRATDVVRARRFELVDARGVPLATLAPGRTEGGGELTLRDRDGERRVNLTAEPGSASLGLQGGRADDPSGTAALRSDANGAALGLLGAKASLTATVRRDQPRLSLTDARGKEAFAAPWGGKPSGR